MTFQADLYNALLARGIVSAAYGCLFSSRSVPLPWAKALLIFSVTSGIAVATDLWRRKLFKAAIGHAKNLGDT